MSKVKVNEIDKRSGSTLTLGGSGTTVQLGTGATQTGFGRTGTVNWDTTAKTAAFTAVSGNGYFVDTSSSAITVTLPASPSAGDIVAVKDYAGTFDTNNLTLARNGSNIEGNAEDKVYSQESLSITFVYADSTKGWLAVNDMNQSQIPQYVTATGGTVTTVCTDYKVHTFTSPGTFEVTNAGNAAGSNKIDYLVIAGGGGGGSNGGGGGAGGYRFSDGTASGSYTAGPSPLGASALDASLGCFPITVGAGGPANPTPLAGNRGGTGSNSIFSTITSAGGGGGGSQNTCVQLGGSGGSGGGGGQSDNPNPFYPGGCSQGSGNTPPVDPPQGNDGGKGSTGGTQGGGGGGGAGATGGPATPLTGTPTTGGDGGAGLTSCITASPVARGGGGGGTGIAANGSGGTGGGGAGSSGTGTSGTANTGGGGGGAQPTSHAGGAGGSGIVIIRYKFQ